MKTILFVSPTATLDNGAEISMFNLMKYLSIEGYRVINVAPTYMREKSNSYSEKFKAHKIDCILIDTQRWWWEDAPGHLFGTDIERATSYRENILKITQIIEEKNVDLVITNTVNMFQGAVASAIKGKPHFWLIHEFPKNEFEYYKDKIDFIKDYSSAIFAVNGQLKKCVTEMFGDQDILSFSPYTDIKSITLKKGKEYRVVSIGRITRGKNQLELIKAYEALGNTKVDLVFIGGWDEEYKAVCMEYIKENKIKGISFLGNKENPWAELTDRDICVFPSSMETFGLVYVEAIMNGIPIILSDNPGHQSAYEMFNKGEMYSLGDIDELASKIKNMLNQFEQKKKEAIDFVDQAKKIYDISHVCGEIIEAINNTEVEQRNSIAHLKNLLTLNEKKSKLAKAEFKIRKTIQRIKFKIFRK